MKRTLALALIGAGRFSVGGVRGAYLDTHNLLIEGPCTVTAAEPGVSVAADAHRTLIGAASHFDRTRITADIDAAIGVGRVVRALKLSSQPPKAGVRFPAELSAKLSAAATGNLTPDASVVCSEESDDVLEGEAPSIEPVDEPDEE
jgi:hypothetical protein